MKYNGLHIKSLKDNNMKTYTKFSDVPSSASYLGSEYGGGSIDENLADYIDSANEPACYKDEEGIKHYFDLQ